MTRSPERCCSLNILWICKIPQVGCILFTSLCGIVWTKDSNQLKIWVKARMLAVAMNDILHKESSLWCLSEGLMTFFYISYLMTDWLMLYAAIFACQTFMRKDYTLFSTNHTLTLREVSSNVRNNFPWTPPRFVQLISPLPWKWPVIRFHFNLSLILLLIHAIHSGIS